MSALPPESLLFCLWRTFEFALKKEGDGLGSGLEESGGNRGPRPALGLEARPLRAGVLARRGAIPGVEFACVRGRGRSVASNRRLRSGRARAGASRPARAGRLPPFMFPPAVPASPPSFLPSSPSLPREPARSALFGRGRWGRAAGPAALFSGG